MITCIGFGLVFMWMWLIAKLLLGYNADLDRYSEEVERRMREQRRNPMSHGERSAKKENRRRDYWSKRPGNRGGGVRSKYTKTQTHRIERRNAKKEEP